MLILQHFSQQAVFRDNEIPYVFLYRGTVDIDKLSLQEDEVDEVRWFDLDMVWNVDRGGRFLPDHFRSCSDAWSFFPIFCDFSEMFHF